MLDEGKSGTRAGSRSGHDSSFGHPGAFRASGHIVWKLYRPRMNISNIKLTFTVMML